MNSLKVLHHEVRRWLQQCLEWVGLLHRRHIRVRLHQRYTQGADWELVLKVRETQDCQLE